MLIPAGPRTTTNIAGNRQKISGTSSLTCSFWAFSSARWRRLTRITLDCSRNTSPIEIPSSDDCTIAATNARSSETSVRSASARSAWFATCQPASPAALERTLRRSGRTYCARRGECCVEAHARLDTDGEHVHPVRQALLQCELSLLAADAQQNVRQEQPEGAQSDGKKHGETEALLAPTRNPARHRR